MPTHLGVQISKGSIVDNDPAAGILHHLERHPADLLVLATKDAQVLTFHVP